MTHDYRKGRGAMQSGPQPHTREVRWEIVHEITERARAVHGDSLLAIGVYGSMARGTDAPYSDVEMLCVLRNDAPHESHEWSVGPWKAEVGVLSRAAIICDAGTLDFDWSLTQGAYLDLHAIYDPAHFFPTLREHVFGHSVGEFDQELRATLIGELYEVVAKVRNALETGHHDYLPLLVAKTATVATFAIGLANRHCYTGAAVMLQEALALDDRPDGYDDLCRLVMRGDLADARRILGLCDALWMGVELWASNKGITLYESRRVPF